MTADPRPSVRRLACAVAALAVALASGSSPVHALSFAEIPPLRRVIAEAPLAFRGEVLDVRYHQAELGERRFPFKEIRFIVDRAYSGTQNGAIVTICQIGGRLADNPTKALVFPGLPDWVPGDRVIAFSNDRLHPLFGTSYGDAGMFRIFEADDRKDYLLSHSLHRLGAGDEGLTPLPGEICRPVPGDRGHCQLESIDDTELAGAFSFESGDRPPRQPLTPKKFDQMVKRVLRDRPSPSGPAQTVSGDPVRFREFLENAAP